MKGYYYYKALRKTIIQFLDIFNDIYVARYDADGVLIKTFKVPLKFAPKEKVYYYIFENNKREEMLPIMAVDIASIDFAEDRLVNKHKRISVSKDTTTSLMSSYLTPIPYNITFNLNIWSLYIIDIDQIYEQILPFFTPYIFIRVYIPELDSTFDIKVILQGSSSESTLEMGEEDERIIKWNSSFVVQTYLFKPLSDVGIVKKVFPRLFTSKTGFGNRNTESIFTSGAAPSAAAESMFLEGTGYDADAAILYDYEVFPKQ